MLCTHSSGVSMRNDAHGKIYMCALFNNLILDIGTIFTKDGWFNTKYVFIFASNLSANEF